MLRLVHSRKPARAARFVDLPHAHARSASSGLPLLLRGLLLLAVVYVALWLVSMH